MTIPPNNAYPKEYMKRLDAVVEDSQWVKKAIKGEDCRKAVPLPNPSDYMGRLDYMVKIDRCNRVSKLFGAPK